MFNATLDGERLKQRRLRIFFSSYRVLDDAKTEVFELKYALEESCEIWEIFISPLGDST